MKISLLINVFKKKTQLFCKNWSWQWIIIILFAIFSLWLMFFTFGYQDGQFLIRTRLWSDFAAHLPLIRSFSLGHNFPPEYPQFANEPIRYHFLFFYLVGFLEKLGLNLAWALNILSTIGFFGLLSMIYFLTKSISSTEIKKPKFTIAAGVLAVILFLFNGSLTFVDYFQEHGFSFEAVYSIFQLEQFVNFGPWNGDDISAFWNWNIYTNQRHLAFGFALSLVVIWPLVQAVFNKESIKNFSLKNYNKISWFLIILAIAVFPFLNLAAYSITVVFVVAWLALNPKLVKLFGPIYGSALLFSLPSLFYFLNLGTGSLEFHLGFLAQGDKFVDIVFYWWRNLGLYLFLWPILFLLSNVNQKKWLLIFSFYFILANSFRLSTDIINNHKLINFFQIGLVILLASKLIFFWLKHWLIKIIIVVLIFPLTLSGVLDAAAIVNDRRAAIQDPREQPIGSWILKNTHPNATFLITSYLYNPASLVGRKTYLDYGYFAWSMGYDDSQRRVNLPAIFALEVDQNRWCQLIRQEKIDYILLSPGKGDLNINVYDSWLVSNNSPAYKTPDGYLLFKIADICLDGVGQL